MAYIIDPMFFYWANVVDNIRFTAGIIGLLSFAICSIAGINFLDYYYYSEQKRNTQMKIIKCSIIPMIICFLIILFVPSKETMYQMLAAKMVTVENVQIAAETGKELVNMITEQITTIIQAAK